MIIFEMYLYLIPSSSKLLFRRKKVWVHFSRWNADFSDDDSGKKRLLFTLPFSCDGDTAGKSCDLDLYT